MNTALISTIGIAALVTVVLGAMIVLLFDHLGIDLFDGLYAVGAVLLFVMIFILL